MLRRASDKGKALISRDADPWPDVCDPAPEYSADGFSEDPSPKVAPESRAGRGAASNRSGRFERQARAPVDDGWGALETVEALAPVRTEITMERPKTIITRNDSPDIPFDRSINPYRGCEHGCVYCYARPTHAFMGLSPGLDFETRLFVKEGAAALLEHEISAPNYTPKVIAIGTNTDPYQPIERRHRIMREVLEVLTKANHPVGITTKSALCTRDIDLLAPMAAKGLARVALSITTLDRRLARGMEPRASTPERRLEAVRILSQAGLPTAVSFAPVIPGLNDHEIESVLQRAAEAGAGGVALDALGHLGEGSAWIVGGGGAFDEGHHCFLKGYCPLISLRNIWPTDGARLN